MKLKELKEQDFLKRFDQDGYVLVNDAIPEAMLKVLKNDLEDAMKKESEFHGTNSYEDYGRLLACPIYGGSFLDLLNRREIFKVADWIFKQSSILYVYTSSSMPPNGTNKSGRIHVDRGEYIENYVEGIGMIVLLDNFDEENGATWVLPGSHKMKEQPDDEIFFQNAKRICAPAGSILYFNLRLWHAGGVNNSSTWRHALAMGLVRPHLKQRIDLPRAMKDMDLSLVEDFVKQKLGFHSQAPSSLEEYYAPKESRLYKEESRYNDLT